MADHDCYLSRDLLPGRLALDLVRDDRGERVLFDHTERLDRDGSLDTLPLWPVAVPLTQVRMVAASLLAGRSLSLSLPLDVHRVDGGRVRVTRRAGRSVLVELSPAEARQVAAALVELADAADAAVFRP